MVTQGHGYLSLMLVMVLLIQCQVPIFISLTQKWNTHNPKPMGFQWQGLILGPQVSIDQDNEGMLCYNKGPLLEPKRLRQGPPMNDN